ncbi:dipeptide ABC transporter ATP-binding protein [Pseudomonas kitaguniensis]|uniref:dipeptide ABC transporter ATP-binding protein n=1 Tax=Pseudomonas kitaguniensis TaxID=2607908 RepID=UPI003D075ADF
MSQPLLEVSDLSVRYGSKIAVQDLNFSIGQNEAVALVGESGSGKSTTALSILKLNPSASLTGKLLFEGEDLGTASSQRLSAVRGARIGVVFQDPMSSLNPVYTVGGQIAEAILAHDALCAKKLRERVIELLELVRIPEPQKKIDAYPHELSGGQRQRVVIAIAVASSAKLLIADEPTTALDAHVQLSILELIASLRRELSMGLLLISHDLPIVSKWTDRVVVMKAGRKVDELQSDLLFSGSGHPYTLGLAAATLRVTDARHYTDQRLPEQGVAGQASAVGRIPDAARTPTAGGQPSPILAVENLVVDYKGRSAQAVRAVDNVSFELSAGETLGLVGESGSGKSSLSKAVMHLIDKTSGSIRFAGGDTTGLKGSGMRNLRQNLQMVFQDPYSSLNPRHTVEQILGTALKVHKRLSAAQISAAVAQCLDDVGLPKGSVSRYPYEFSGGQRQRVAIARAIILRPSLIICDEPVSALDVSVQAQILNLMSDLKREHGLTYLFISHDIAVVQYMSDRVMVMSKGQIIETGTYQEVLKSPKHPYTQDLIKAS